jgi:hypothetical protein
MRTQLDRCTPTLIPRCKARSERLRGYLPALPGVEVAPVPIRLPDQFHSLREVAALSNTPFRLHMKSLDWCSVNQTGGLITRDDLFLVCAGTGASERHAAECERTGAWHDARYDCGSRFCLGPQDVDGWVVHDFYRWYVPEEAAIAEDASALDKRRSSDAARKRRERDRKAALSTGPKRKRGRPRKATGEDVIPTVKPQVRNASRDLITDTSDDQDLYLHGDKPNPDQDQSQDQNQEPAVTRERNRAPRVVRATVRALCKKTGRPVSDDDALFAITVLEVRAEKAGTVIHDPEKYFPAAVRREADLAALLPGVMAPAEDAPEGGPPPWDRTAPVAAPLSPGDPHMFVPIAGDPHETGSCVFCTMPSANRKYHPLHLQARSA